MASRSHRFARYHDDADRMVRRFGRALTRDFEAIREAKPGSPIPVSASTPGSKRDGADISALPYYLERYEENPIILPFHDGRSWAIGNGFWEPFELRGRHGLAGEVEFDIEDPQGAIADRKYRSGIMRAWSIGFDLIDRAGLPTSQTRKRAAAVDLMEVSTVAVPADWDALTDPDLSVADIRPHAHEQTPAHRRKGQARCPLRVPGGELRRPAKLQPRG